MSDFKHTPGPWRYMDDGYVVAEDDEGCLIARVEKENALTSGVVGADGALIAAAPDLLRELEFATYDAHVANDHPWEYTVCADERCTDRRAAIAKAKGE